MSRSSMQHANAVELVRSMTHATRVDPTHIRAVLVHVEDRRGVLEALLDPSVLKRSIKIDTAQEARTVEAFACELMGTSFHALTFSLRPDADQWFPATSLLTVVETDGLCAPPEAQPDPLETERHAVYDTARRSTSMYATFPEEFLIEVPWLGDPTDVTACTSFRDVALRVTGLTASMNLPLSFVHAPVAVPARSNHPRGVTGPCLRFGVAFRRFGDSHRLSFGRKLVGLCCAQGYGLWQRSTTGNGDHEYWEPVVPPRAPAGEPGDAAGDDPGTTSGGAGSAFPSSRALAVSCVGPVRPGTTEVVLQMLRDANVPLIALSQNWLDDLAVIHMLTGAPPDSASVADTLTDLPADRALRHALGLPGPAPDDHPLRDHRALVSSRDLRPSASQLAALWAGWATPATPDALGLIAKTIRGALDGMSSRYGRGAPSPRDGHCNIEYVVCREVVGADRLQGRLRVAVDLDALGVTSGQGSVSGAQLGRFCSDLERLWRKSLSSALRTTHVNLDVVWRESWLGRWASLRSTPDDDRW